MALLLNARHCAEKFLGISFNSQNFPMSRYDCNAHFTAEETGALMKLNSTLAQEHRASKGDGIQIGALGVWS